MKRDHRDGDPVHTSSEHLPAADLPAADASARPFERCVDAAGKPWDAHHLIPRFQPLDAEPQPVDEPAPRP